MKAVLVLFSLMVIPLLMMENSKSSARKSHHATKNDASYGVQNEPEKIIGIKSNKKGRKQSSSKSNFVKKKKNRKFKQKVKGRNMKAKRAKGKKGLKNKGRKNNLKKKDKRVHTRKNKDKNNKNNKNIAKKRKSKKKLARQRKNKQRKMHVKRTKIKYFKHKNNVKNSEKYKYNSKMGRQPRPVAACDFIFMNDINGLDKKHRDVLAKLQRIVRFWRLLQSKNLKATGSNAAPVEPPTFSIPFNNLDSATTGGTSCNCLPIPPAPLGIYTKLSTCTTTAAWACSTDDIIYDRVWPADSKPPCAGACCSALGACTSTCSNGLCSLTSPTCTSTCTRPSPLPQYLLTQAMIDHINNVCIPQLRTWTLRFTSCQNKKPETTCNKGCQTNENFFMCQANKCLCDHTTPTRCAFETCLQSTESTPPGTSTVEDCQCDCYKQLDPVASPFPIDTTTIFESTNQIGPGLHCITLAGFERLVKIRKDRCMKPGGITDAENAITNPAITPTPPFPSLPAGIGPGMGLTPDSPPPFQRNSGNFGDCRYQGREAFPWIFTCKVLGLCISSSGPVPLTASTSRAFPGRIKFLLAQMKQHRDV